MLSEEVSPLEEIRVSETSYAVMRTPPGEGSFPAILLMHGGIGQYPMSRLKEEMRGVEKIATASLMLAKGYAVVYSTRRALTDGSEYPEQIQDVLALVNTLKARPHVDENSVVVFATSGGGSPGLGVATTGEVSAVAVGEPAIMLWMMTDERGVLVNREEFVKNAKRVYPERSSTRVLLNHYLTYVPLEEFTPALQAGIRRKMAGARTPIFLLQGDRGGQAGLVFRNFVSGLAAVDRPVQAILYPGEWHGFYWGKHTDKLKTVFQVADDLDTFFRKNIEVQPRPAAPEHIRLKTIDMGKQMRAMKANRMPMDTNKDGKVTAEEARVYKSRNP